MFTVCVVAEVVQKNPSNFGMNWGKEIFREAETQMGK